MKDSLYWLLMCWIILAPGIEENRRPWYAGVALIVSVVLAFKEGF
jgi:hypothetical protein